MPGSGSRARSAFVAWGRMLITVAALLVQLAVLVVVVVFFARLSPWLLGLQVLLAVVVTVSIVASNMPPEYKLAWTIPILLAPLFGGVFYLLYGARMFTPKERARLTASWQQGRRALQSPIPPPELLPSGASASAPVPSSLASVPALARRQAHYLETVAHYPPYQDTCVDYYPLGELGFAAMLEAMEQAEHYILFQYFIVSAGTMWDQMFDVMARKAAAGVEVRVLYDDVGSYFTLPRKFDQTLTEAGIKVQAINPFGPRVKLRYNNRNHSKILVIDGRVAFTGGINIADEYINAKVVYGHWKDTVVRVEGSAAWSFAVMFLTVWNERSEPTDFEHFRLRGTIDPPRDAPGWVQPFDDSPFDDDPVGLESYLAMIDQAQHSVRIMTPYLILDSRMVRTLVLAAQSGVRVQIVTPHWGDSSIVHEVTRSYYEVLVAAGVQIWEYTPGYVHAKVVVADDDTAVVGTINFDYRSFYLHQECAVWLHEVDAIADIIADVDATIAISTPMTLEYLRSIRWPRRVWRAILRTFAPMM